MANPIVPIEAWQPWRGELVIHRGETFDPLLTWSAGGVLVDWTGYTGEMIIDPIGDGTPITLSTANGGMAMDDAGNMSWLMSDTDTAALTWASGSFSVYLTEPSGSVRLDGRGSVRVD